MTRRAKFLIAFVVAMLVASTGTAYAFWTAGASGNAAATATSLNAPTGGAATADSATQITVNWTNPGTQLPGAQYRVTRTSGPGSPTVVCTVSSPSCADTGLSANTTYGYSIAAVLGTDWVSGTTTASTATNSGVQPATKLVFGTQPVGNVAEGVNFTTSPVVQVQDAGSNVVTTDTGNVTLAIDSGPAAGILTCSDPGFPTVAAVAGVAAFTNCQITGPAAAGTYTLVATRSGLTSTGASSNVVINAGAANKLAFTSAPVAGPQATTTTLGPLTIQVQDSFGNPVVGARTVNLSSTGTPRFATTQNVTGTTSLALSISAGSSSGTFYYGNNTAGTPTITAASTSPTTITSATQQATIGSNKLVITSAPVSGTANSNATLGPITVELQNVAGTPINAASNITVNLSSTGNERFALTSGGAAVTSVTISSGSSSANFFYGDTLAGTPTITASATNHTAGAQNATITAGVAAGISFANVTTNNGAATATCTGTVGSASFACTITPHNQNGGGRFMTANATLIDQFQNVATNTSGSAIVVSLTQTGGSSLSVASVSIANGASTSTTTFTLNLPNGNGNGTVTATATVGGNAVQAKITS